MVKKPTLSTAADSLLDLIKLEREISFKEAAKKLNVSLDTVESWAYFLQEGGVVSIKYKFTTPYVVLPDSGVVDPEKSRELRISRQLEKSRESIHKVMSDSGTYAVKAPDSSVKKMESRENFRKIKNLLSSFSKNLERGEFLVLDEIVNDSLSFLNKNVRYLLEDKRLSPQKKVEISENMKRLEKKVASASDLVKAKKFDDASRIYSEAKEEMKLFSERIEGNIREQEQLRVDYDSVKKLFMKTHSLLDSGRLDEATDTYDEAEGIIKGLSDKIEREKTEMQRDIIRLNQDFASITIRARREKFNETAKKIKDLSSRARESLRKGDTLAARQYYREIEASFKDLPPGFSKEREAIKKGLIKLFSRIFSEEERGARDHFNFFYKKIMNILKDSKKPGVTLGESTRMYREMKSLFNNLPNGFMREKLEIQRELIFFYDRLSKAFEYLSDNSFKRGVATINGLVRLMRSQVDAGDLKNASYTYVKINALFGSLPVGFLDEKTRIQQSILDVYNSLIDRKAAMEKPSRKTSKSVSDIDRLLKELDKRIIDRDYPQAYLLYKRIKNVYNSIDSLGPDERKTVTARILATYKQVVLLRNLQKEHSLRLPPMIHVDPKRKVKDMIQDLKARYKTKAVMP